MESYPIAKKRNALFLTYETENVDLKTALQDFVSRLEDTAFTGLVVDYDGTLSASDRRYEPLDQDMKIELNRLLDEGIKLGVASGRGGSVHEQLRNSVRREHWDGVIVGLYNGSRILRLSQELASSLDQIPDSLEAARAHLRPLKKMLGLEMVSRPHQISLRVDNGLDPFELRNLVIEHLAEIEGVSAVASAHSVDILLSNTCKTAVVDALDPDHLGFVLRIGDQGSAGGNDFKLLNTGMSLSVDRVSSNLKTCWNLGAHGLHGHRLTLNYLRALQRRIDGFHFDTSLLRGSK